MRDYSTQMSSRRAYLDKFLLWKASDQVGGKYWPSKYPTYTILVKEALRKSFPVGLVMASMCIDDRIIRHEGIKLKKESIKDKSIFCSASSASQRISRIDASISTSTRNDETAGPAPTALRGLETSSDHEKTKPSSWRYSIRAADSLVDD